MIPLGDEGTPQERHFPIVNVTIIAINIVVFLLQLVTGLDNGPITTGWSLVPKEITTGQDIIGPSGIAGLTLGAAPLHIVYLTLLTSMFMHGGWLHIASNMLFLFIFGDNVENNFGHVKYLLFYLLCGFGADAAQIAMGGADSLIPNLGASGAIAGVLAAYLVLFPGARIRALIPFGGAATVSYVPALVMIGIWIVTQILSVFLAGEEAAGRGGGVAYWAHVGGFVTGIVLTFLFRSRESSTTYPAYTR